MTELIASRESARAADDEISLLALASVLLRRRWLITGIGLFGAALGLSSGLLSTRVYLSDATFIPQGSDGGASGLTLAASQLGLRLPSSGGTWGPAVYVELLHSRSLLEPIALDTLVVAEESGRRVAVTDLLGVKDLIAAHRVAAAVSALENIVKASEDKALGAVKVSVITRWPSVSLALAERLVKGVNQFNLQTRKSQAGAERQFVEVQAGEAERALRAAEDRMQSFMQRNRVAGSPELTFERDRLQRDVNLRQQVYTTLLQNGEDAKIREVRDTPVITVLETPRLPVSGVPRKSVFRAMLGGIAGGLLGILIAFVAQGTVAARGSRTDEAREFNALMAEVFPKFLRKRGSEASN